MKRLRAYLVINTSIPPENPDKVAGVFWIRRNAKNFAWQLNTESAESHTGEPYVVEKYWFASRQSVVFESN